MKRPLLMVFNNSPIGTILVDDEEIRTSVGRGVCRSPQVGKFVRHYSYLVN